MRPRTKSHRLNSLEFSSLDLSSRVQSQIRVAHNALVGQNALMTPQVAPLMYLFLAVVAPVK